MADFFKHWGQVGQWNEAPQLDEIASADSPSFTTGLVTLSLGGNDSGFAQIIDSCVSSTLLHQRDELTCIQVADTFAAFGQALMANGGRIVVHTSTDAVPGTTWDFCDSTCANGNPNATITVPNLGELLRQIHARAPNAKIRVLLYPTLFPSMPDTATCDLGNTFSVSGRVANELNTLANGLNDTIKSQVTAVRNTGIDVAIADTNQAGLEGHRLCDSQESWINGVILPPGKVYSIHPNAAGQRYFAQTVRDTL
jgi:lysophospholipase L1-like esterase